MVLNKIFSVFAFLLVLVFAVSYVSATVAVTYNVTSAIIEDDGTRTNSTTPINGIYVEGYVCLTSGCTTVGSAVLGLTNYSSTNQVTVTYPNALNSSYGYVLYFHKDGYIGWEQPASWSSPDNLNWNVNSNATIYLSKKRTGYAPIMNLSVVNEVAPNRLVEFNVTAGIDAQTYAAILQNNKTSIPATETVNTTIILRILNESGSIIDTQTRNVLIPYSGVQSVSFDYNFTSEGTYTVNVTTDVLNESKILTSVSQSAIASTRVIQPNLTNYTYVLIQNLNMQPAFAFINQQINFTYNWLANYVNESGSLFPVNASFYTTVTRNNGAYYNSYLFSLANANVSNYNSSMFNLTFTETGNYIVSIRGIANSTLGNQTFESTQQLTFVIGTNGTNNDGHIDDNNNNNDDDTDEDDEILKILSSQKSGSAVNSTVIDLTSHKALFNFNALMWIFLILVFLVLVAIFLVLIFKFGLFN